MGRSQVVAGSALQLEGGVVVSSVAGVAYYLQRQIVGNGASVTADRQRCRRQRRRRQRRVDRLLLLRRVVGNGGSATAGPSFIRLKQRVVGEGGSTSVDGSLTVALRDVWSTPLLNRRLLRKVVTGLCGCLMGTVWSAVVMCRAGLSDGLMWSARVGRAQVVSKRASSNKQYGRELIY